MMNRDNLKRNSLRKNFLKEIIMRLDFNGVLQAEMDRILIEAKPYLREKGFNRFETKVNNQIVNEDDTIKEINAQIIYSFTADAAGYTIEISNACLLIVVRSQRYADFDDYGEIFTHIAQIYQEKIDFFTPVRFGLRKINFCFIRNREEINNFFLPEYYGCQEPVDGSTTQQMERRDVVSIDKQSINLGFLIEQGIVDQREYYKITLDIDNYSTDRDEIEKILFTEKTIVDINNRMFRTYISVLSDKMIELLCSEEDLADESILGIESNE